MSTSQVLNAESSRARGTFIIEVNFLHGHYGQHTTDKTYDFFCNTLVQDGDVVVVETVNGLQLAKVIGVKSKSTKAKSWVVQKVDLTEYQQRKYAELRRSELEAEMHVRAAEAKRLKVFRDLAETDPVMKKLLDEHEQVSAQMQSQMIWDVEVLPGQ